MVFWACECVCLVLLLAGCVYGCPDGKMSFVREAIRGSPALMNEG